MRFLAFVMGCLLLAYIFGLGARRLFLLATERYAARRGPPPVPAERATPVPPAPTRPAEPAPGPAREETHTHV